MKKISMKSKVWHLDATIVGRLVLLAAGAVLFFLASVAFGQSSRPLDPREVERLEADARLLDADAADAAKTPDGQRRVTEALAKQFNVGEAVVTDLRSQKLGWGEVAITLALSQELMKKQGLSQDAAIKAVLDKRQAGEGWGRIAQDFGFKLGHLISEVKRADKGVARIEHARHEKAEKLVKHENPEKPEKAEKAERPEKPERVQRAERPEKPERGR